MKRTEAVLIHLVQCVVLCVDMQGGLVESSQFANGEADISHECNRRWHWSLVMCTLLVLVPAPVNS